MAEKKEKVLAEAVSILNKEDEPWEVSVEGDSIVARWKWMDAVFFAPHEVNDETKKYTFKVKLNNNGKWKEYDSYDDKGLDVDFSDGQITFGKKKDVFKGTSTQKSFEVGIGADKQSGKVGILVFKFDTDRIKKPMREYLKSCGWKKAGLFG